MAHAEDDVHWGQELKELPSPLRSTVVAIRLGGPIILIVALVGIIIGQALGIFDDQASRERRSILQYEVEALQQTRKNEQILVDLKAQLAVHTSLVEKHTAATESIARTMCLVIPRLTDGDRHACMTGGIWRIDKP